jgi:L-2-hydroxyglutarate oxidase
MSSNISFDLAVIGGGVVGLATAYKYQLKYPQKRVVIIEKEAQLAQHQTGRNSGVIHSGIYYKPGSYKAKTCLSGRKQLVKFAQENNVPHDVCGKIILATSPAELPLLDKIYQRGVENGIENISYIDPPEIKAIEPFVEGVKAIKVPVTGIIDYAAFCHKLWEKVHSLNSASQLVLNTKVLSTTAEGVLTNQGIITAKQKVFCAGLQSDRLAKKDGAKANMAIVGFRGDYYELTTRGKHKVKHLIYPVPDPEFPFLGVHFTRMIDGSVECGPNAVFSFKREGYSKTSFNLKDTWQALTYQGTWKLFFKHTRKGLQEYKRAFSKRLFLKALQKMIPSLTMNDIQPVRSGVRAQALTPQGDLVDDFKIVKKEDAIHVLNAPSPAATASLAIADEILRIAEL